MLESTIIIISIISLVGLLCQWLAWSIKLPAILFLLIAGMLLGNSGLGWVDPNELLGDLFFPLVSLSVAIILFEGSLTLKFEEIVGLEKVVRRLVGIGALCSWLIISIATHLVLKFDWAMSLLFGSLVVVTGPTVIIPMLRSVRPNKRIANILRWEGIVIDPIGALLAVLVYESIISLSAGEGFNHTVLIFIEILSIGGLLGCLAAYCLGLILRHQLLPVYLHNLGTIAVVLFTFSLSNHFVEESGLLAVTIMGIWLANMRDVNVEEILSFKENLSILLISGLFILLAARIELDQLLSIGWPALILLAIIQFVARPLVVALCTTGSELKWQERSLIAWIGPRGIVAAAVSAFFALRLESAGYPQASILVPLTFIVIIGTVVLQSATSRILATVLKVAEPAPRGFLIVGANSVARALGKAISDQGYDALLVDTSWENIRAARMEGLNTFYGNPVSIYADKHLDLIGLGRLIAASPQRELNALSCMRYRVEFGHHNLFAIPVLSEKTTSDKVLISAKHKGRTLFSRDFTYRNFSSLLTQGAKIRTTLLTETFSFEDFKQSSPNAIPLFGMSKNGSLHVFTDEKQLLPKADWQIISISEEQQINA